MDLSMLRPNAITIALFLVLASLEFVLLSPILSNVSAVPCVIEGNWESCTINPLGMKVESAYFGSFFLDYIYQFLYLAIMVVIPYFASCLMLYGYRVLAA